MAKTTPIVHHNQLWLFGADHPFCAVDSPAWFAWLAQATTFRYQSNCRIRVTSRFSRSMNAISVRRELRRHCYLWYAYRRVDGTLHKRYVGKVEALTLARLDAISAELNLL